MVIEKIFCAMMRVFGLGSCDEVKELCYEYGEKNLPAGGHRRMKRHLKICKPCLRFISSYLAVRALSKTMHSEKLSPDQKNKLVEGLLNA